MSGWNMKEEVIAVAMSSHITGLSPLSPSPLRCFTSCPLTRGLRTC